MDYGPLEDSLHTQGLDDLLGLTMRMDLKVLQEVALKLIPQPAHVDPAAVEQDLALGVQYVHRLRIFR